MVQGTHAGVCEALNAKTVCIDYDYPFFVEKQTPVTQENCLVQYRCICSAKSPVVGDDPAVSFRMEIPCITTYPVSDSEKPGGLFGQLSVMDLAVVSNADIYPEDLVELVDRHALSPIYSFLTEEDQTYLIDQIHSSKKTSVVVVDAVKSELAQIGTSHGMPSDAPTSECCIPTARSSRPRRVLGCPSVGSMTMFRLCLKSHGQRRPTCLKSANMPELPT